MPYNKFYMLLAIVLMLVNLSCGENNAGTDGDTDGDMDIEQTEQESDSEGYIDGDEDTDSDNESTDEDTMDGEESTVGSVNGKATLKKLDDNSGIDILLVSEGNIVDRTKTDSDGGYQFNKIEPGTYGITASWGDFTVEKYVSTKVNVLAAKTALPEDLELTPTGNLEGVILLENAQTGNLGIEIFITGHSYMARTNDAGEWLISGVPVGTYQLCTDMVGYEMQCIDDVEIIAGQTGTLETLSLKETEEADPSFAILSGKVLLSGEDDHSGTTITLADTELSALTDSDGNYTIKDIPQGKYDIVFDAPEESGYEKGITIPNYVLWAGVRDNTLPVVNLDYGKNLSEPEATNISREKRIEESGIAIFINSGMLYKYDSTTEQLTLLSGDVTDVDDYEILADNKGIVFDTESLYYYVNIDIATPSYIGKSIMSSKYSPDFSAMIYYEVQPGDGRLYYMNFADGERTLVVNSIGSPALNEDWSELLYKTDDDDLYRFDTSNRKSTLLIEDVSSYETNNDLSKILYKKYAGNYQSDLYIYLYVDGTSTLLVNDIKDFDINEDWTKAICKTIDSSEYGLHIASLADKTVHFIGENITSHTLNNDWTAVIYETSGVSSQVYSLYRSNAPEYTSEKLSENVYDHKFSDSMTTLAYREYPAPYNLYAVSLLSGSPVLKGSSDEDYQLSPDGNYVVFTSDSSPYNTYLAPTSSGTIKTIVESASIRDIEFSTDSSKVLVTTNGYDRYLSHVSGDAEILVLEDGSYNNFFINDDWTKLIYKNTENKIRIVSIDSGTSEIIGENVYKITIGLDWSRMYYETDSDDIYLVELGTLTTTLIGSDYDRSNEDPDLTFMIYTTNADEVYYADLLTGDVGFIGENIYIFTFDGIIPVEYIIYITADSELHYYSITDKTTQYITFIYDLYNILVLGDFSAVIQKTTDNELISTSIQDQQTTVLGENVSHYSISEDQKYIIYSDTNGISHRVSTDGTEHQTLRAAEDSMVLFDDFNHILYTKIFTVENSYFEYSCNRLNVAIFD